MGGAEAHGVCEEEAWRRKGSYVVTAPSPAPQSQSCWAPPQLVALKHTVETLVKGKALAFEAIRVGVSA